MDADGDPDKDVTFQRLFFFNPTKLKLHKFFKYLSNTFNVQKRIWLNSFKALQCDGVTV